MDDYEVRSVKDDSLITWNKNTKLPVLNSRAIKFVPKVIVPVEVVIPSIGNLRVYVKEGRSLLAMDANGKSDPYVKIFTNQMANDYFWVSSVQEKTLNPTWSSTDVFTCAVYSLPIILKIEIWDKDVGSPTDDFIGKKNFVFEKKENVYIENSLVMLEAWEPNDRIKQRGDILMDCTITFEGIAPPTPVVVASIPKQVQSVTRASNVPNSSASTNRRKTQPRSHAQPTLRFNEAANE